MTSRQPKPESIKSHAADRIIAKAHVRIESANREINADLTIESMPERDTGSRKTKRGSLRNSRKDSETSKKREVRPDGLGSCILRILKHLETHSLNIRFE
jgi:hypothetical protein